MIYGIGTDLIDIDRMAAAYARHGDRLVARLLAPAEREQLDSAKDKPRYLAKRWAAKEAFGKALGTAIRPPVTLAGLCIEHDVAGKPGIKVDTAIAHYMNERGITGVHLSLSDERGAVVAFVVLETG
ncbi:holo-ACP synthase [Chitinimonas sp. BJYL2]|uniref:holo-ACP synthase n=1 Tax=Chitinimonas sp. BJYL2 TaxID=2976696 RepID=UPI0022B322E6|nr:holo-ACP synthase [Chitinimonas sp. BJYL2]